MRFREGKLQCSLVVEPGIVYSKATTPSTLLHTKEREIGLGYENTSLVQCWTFKDDSYLALNYIPKESWQLTPIKRFF